MSKTSYNYHPSTVTHQCPPIRTNMEWRYSVPIDPELLQKAGAFTLLPARRHKNDKIPEEALESLLSDYRKIFNDGKESKIPATMTPDGEMNIFILPEALPERLALASRLNGVAIIHDGKTLNLSSRAKLITSDVTEGLDATAAIQQSRDLDDSLDPTFSDKGKFGHHTGAYKKLMSKYVYEMVRMDREVGAYMLDLYSKNWTQKIHRPENLAVNTFDDYMRKRLWDVGVKSVSMTASTLSILTTDMLCQTFVCHPGICIRLQADATRERNDRHFSGAARKGRCLDE